MAVPPDPKTLFNIDETRKLSWLSDKISLIGGGILGGGANIFRNHMLSLPYISGIQRTAAYTLVGVVIGYFLHKRRIRYHAERDEILRHYIELHPEDFPTPERKKFQDLFLPWGPMR